MLQPMLMSDLTGTSGQVLKPVSEVIVLESRYVTITQVSLALHGSYSDVKISVQTSYFFNTTKKNKKKKKTLGRTYHEFQI